jgi:hypothetical protein
MHETVATMIESRRSSSDFVESLVGEPVLDAFDELPDRLRLISGGRKRLV